MDIVSNYLSHCIDSLNKTECHGFRFLHCNIRSLSKNFDKLLEIVSSVRFSFHIICLSETFLYDNQQKCLPIPNYVFLGDCRPTRCGRTGVYNVRSGLAVSDWSSVSLAGAEAVSVSLVGVGGSPLHITLIYRTSS